DCVTMMTIHSAKGLEFPLVYVVGMEEGIFPGSSAQYDQEEIEEERRLCYVAMTRAKERLTMTNARQRMLYGRTSSNRSSRFLDEIPEDNMRWEGKPEPRFGGGEAGGSGVPAYGGAGYSGYGGRTASGAVRSYRETVARAAPQRPAAKGGASAPVLELRTGDEVEHTAFGQGTVLEVKPMSGDAMVTVQFQGIEKPKRLMLKFAGSHMKKL
ncbi:MAG: ATP-binding domain-containing protein, partial [Oscillibacter sp.]|nr:ATP-binding domain-containing protein [Oscillibacter sp.]